MHYLSSLIILLSLIVIPISAHEWTQQCLDRIEASARYQEEEKAVYALQYLNPIGSGLYSDFRMARIGSELETNIGFGYRTLVRGCLLGLNAFQDFYSEHGHTRYSVGGEVAAPTFWLAANCYNAMSGRKRTKSDGPWVYSERTLDGYDVVLAVPCPYIPWMELESVVYHWKGHSRPNVRGGSASLLAHLNKFMSVELGIDYNSYETEAFFSFILRPGRPSYIEYIAEECGSSCYSLGMRCLQPVRRQPRFEIEKRMGTR